MPRKYKQIHFVLGHMFYLEILNEVACRSVKQRSKLLHIIDIRCIPLSGIRLKTDQNFWPTDDNKQN